MGIFCTRRRNRSTRIWPSRISIRRCRRRRCTLAASAFPAPAWCSRRCFVSCASTSCAPAFSTEPRAWCTSPSAASAAFASTRSCARWSRRSADDDGVAARMERPGDRPAPRSRRAQRSAGMKVLVTGAAGFIGMHVALRLKRDGAAVTGVDNLDPYYDVGLKRARADRLGAAGVACETVDLATAAADDLLRHGAFSHVVHLAAQPGVRYSLVNPKAYLRNNVDAFGAVLEGCRHAGVAHLVYASSSSVYGANHTLPFSEEQNVDHPVSLYAATKKANELMAHSYSHLYGLPTTGLRFFTVYGPWGRPDMAMFIFAKAITEGQPIRLFNYGRMRRDFTYVDDIAEGVIRVLARPPAADSGAP